MATNKFATDSHCTAVQLKPILKSTKYLPVVVEITKTKYEVVLCVSLSNFDSWALCTGS